MAEAQRLQKKLDNEFTVNLRAEEVAKAAEVSKSAVQSRGRRRKGIEKEKAGGGRKSDGEDVVMATTMTTRSRRARAESSAQLVKSPQKKRQK